MASLDEHIFGYSRGSVDKKDVCKLSNLFLKLDISSVVKPDGTFTLRESDRSRFITFAKARIRFTLGETCGIVGILRKYRYRYGILLAIISFAFIFIITSSLVWDIRVNGNERLSDMEIEKLLDNSGFRVGSSWRKINKNSIEMNILSENDEIAWISINRRGTVAYVELIESENSENKNNAGHAYSNIIADKDGVVEQISVKSGSAAVRIGDVVRKGDVLISGVVENENGTYFCRAEGEVLAKSVEQIKVEIFRNTVEKSMMKPKIVCVRLSLFNFSVNIFKNYRNRTKDCDIIKENRNFVLFDKYKLPIGLEIDYACEFAESERSLSDDEMMKLAKREADAGMYSLFRDADVIKINTNGAFTDQSYRLIYRVVYSSNIGKEKAIEIS